MELVWSGAAPASVTDRDLVSPARGRFAVLPSNVEATQLAERVLGGECRFALIVGPGGTGKTHLLEAVAARARVAVLRAGDLSHAKQSASDGLLVLDDVEAISGQSKLAIQARILLERRVRAKRPVIAAAATGGIPATKLVPFSRVWRLASIEPPSGDERVVLLNEMCANLGIALPPGAARLTSRTVTGDGRTLRGALTRLRVAAREELASASLVNIAGWLFPYAQASGSYDLRDIVFDAVCRAGGSGPRRLTCSELQSLAAYLLRVHAELPEGAIAEYFGACGGEVFRCVERVRKRLAVGERAMTAAARRAMAFIQERLCDR
ncbi:MAG: hypothetical protein HND42_06685 [Armatimonadetes bacterium]|nr:hypothetical protein [Armatimonadota bacterium]NOG92913.1 hypothetical protein [Armatimonadota bacterium]